MTRSRSSTGWATWAIVTVGLLGGCAFSDGEPWGQAELTLILTHDSQSRRDAQGLLKTSKDYGLDLDTLSLTLTSVTVSLSAEANAAFDPSAPPPGYTLCHNGHCHSESGDLVSYEDIANALATGGESGPSLVQAVERPIDLVGLDGPTQVRLGPCAERCVLEPGFLQSVSVELGAIEIRGRVFDLGGDERLPEGGAAIDGIFPLDARLTRTLSGQVGRGEPVQVGIDLEVEITERLFDDVDWSAYTSATDTIDVGQADIAAAISSRIEEASNLEVEVER